MHNTVPVTTDILLIILIRELYFDEATTMLVVAIGTDDSGRSMDKW